MRIRTLPLLLVAGTSFAYLVAYPLAIGRADESHLLYGAKRILEGDVIYGDFFEIITPLGFYLFAGIYRLAGTTLLAARVGMAIINAAGCALLFHLARRLSGVAEATLATLIVACICLPTWPFASAHWISTALGLLIASVTLAPGRRRKGSTKETWMKSGRYQIDNAISAASSHRHARSRSRRSWLRHAGRSRAASPTKNSGEKRNNQIQVEARQISVNPGTAAHRRCGFAE